MTTFAPDQITLGATITNRLTDNQVLAIVICALAALILGAIYILTRANTGTQPRHRHTPTHRDQLTPETKARIKARVTAYIDDQEGRPR